ncbi:MAG: phosphoglycerate kinase, partial [Flavobacteriales bacterium]
MNSFYNINFNNKKVLLRADLNVPLDKGHKVVDNTRIDALMPTLRKILEDGGSAIIMSHLGRPKGKYEPALSLEHLCNTLREKTGKTTYFASDCIGEEAKEKAKELKKGEILLLENIRFYPEEKKGDMGFAEKLAELGDFYINDAFGTLHRSHASTSVLARIFKENRAFGALVEKELEIIENALSSPKKPFTVVIGGAKVTSKIGVIQYLMPAIDELIIGGGMMYS